MTMTLRDAATRQPARGEDPALSYRRLRLMIGLVGLTLPLTCVVDGLVHGHLESSISYYYYTGVTIVFTGTLVATGLFLIAYRLGTRAVENYATTAAGLAALGVAFFHTAPHDATLRQLRLSDVHTASAAVLFVLLGLIALVLFPIGVAPRRGALRRWYRGLGGAILGAIVAMPVLAHLIPGTYARLDLFFWLEALCVTSFSLSFLIKGLESSSVEA